MPEIADGNTLRSSEFKQLTRAPKTWVIVGLITLLAAAIGAALAPILALAGAAVALLLSLGVCFWIADHRAANAFFQSYAEARGLTWHKGGAALDGTSRFLRKGDKQEVNQLFTGPLGEGIEGSLALYTYTEESTDSDGHRQDTDYPFTVVTARMPETAAHLSDLRLQPKSGLKMLEKFEDSFRRKHERVTLESEAMRDRYEIFVLKEQDPVWVRRLFSPSFIVWLVETPPAKFGCELEDGYFVAYVPKHHENAAKLDEILATATRIAHRIREEVAETTPAADR